MTAFVHSEKLFEKLFGELFEKLFEGSSRRQSLVI